MAFDAVSNHHKGGSLEATGTHRGAAAESQGASAAGGDGATAKNETIPLPSSNIQKMVEAWKTHSGQSNLTVQFDKNEPTDQIWLNLVDKTTGEVVLKLPPEALRLMMQHNQASGLVTDVKT